MFGELNSSCRLEWVVATPAPSRILMDGSATFSSTPFFYDRFNHGGSHPFANSVGGGKASDGNVDDSGNKVFEGTSWRGGHLTGAMNGVGVSFWHGWGWTIRSCSG